MTGSVSVYQEVYSKQAGCAAALWNVYTVHGTLVYVDGVAVLLAVSLRVLSEPARGFSVLALTRGLTPR
jgi:hypothetical protein